MGSIVLLDDATINKIAAGEVVDRPSSIVKELIENSIDAGATKVIIEIKNGGISYIKITDNGCGFASDDVELAFERHATSKIRKEEDLLHIKSMGFRGEALASIAAISKVTLTSKNINESIGVRAIVEAGNILSVEKCGTPQGTIIEVRDVFYNVPARYKFLKKDFTEAGYIEDVVTRIALANSKVSFKLISNGKIILSTLGKGKINDTIYDVFGRDIYNNLIDVNYEYESMRVTGVIGQPCISRSTRSQQFTYINSRYIKDKIISSAIDRACLQKYAIGKFAFVVLNLDINPKHVDVNVHPSKLEVKFDDEGAVFEAVYHSIKNALEQDAIKNSPFSIIKNEVKEANYEKTPSNEEQIKVKYDSLTGDFNVKSIVTKEPEEKEEKIFKPYVAEENQENIYKIAFNSSSNAEENIQIDRNIAIEENLEEIKTEVGKIESVDNILEEKEASKLENIKDVSQTKEPIYYKYVGQVFDTYIIIQIGEKMYIIDQHAAHERLLYEQIKANYFSKNSNSQILLLPILVELTQKEMDAVNENQEILKNVGFEFENFGDRTIKISGVPNIGYDLDYKGVFLDTIDEILGANKTYRESKEDRFIATLACKAAVKGNMNLSYKEQIALLDDMVKLDNPFNCPHGRPTAFEISRYEIERRFLRK